MILTDSTKWLEKPIKITVCADGFVSVTDDMRRRRLGAALPAYSVDRYDLAMEIILRVCELAVCDHGKKMGRTIEPKAPDWRESDVDCIGELSQKLAAAEQEVLKARGEI